MAKTQHGIQSPESAVPNGTLWLLAVPFKVNMATGQAIQYCRLSDL
ncbi:hypothetical protein [Rubripirellula lacrimiformis]|nr:hypothetical protein [Rubripirellula lacrimiformis]